MDDESYESIFVPIITKVMETFQPSAVVLQCGADSLTGDRLGCFNLTVKGINGLQLGHFRHKISILFFESILYFFRSR